MADTNETVSAQAAKWKQPEDEVVATAPVSIRQRQMHDRPDGKGKRGSFGGFSQSVATFSYNGKTIDLVLSMNGDLELLGFEEIPAFENFYIKLNDLVTPWVTALEKAGLIAERQSEEDTNG